MVTFAFLQQLRAFFFSETFRFMKVEHCTVWIDYPFSSSLPRTPDRFYVQTTSLAPHGTPYNCTSSLQTEGKLTTDIRSSTVPDCTIEVGQLQREMCNIPHIEMATERRLKNWGHILTMSHTLATSQQNDLARIHSKLWVSIMNFIHDDPNLSLIIPSKYILLSLTYSFCY